MKKVFMLLILFILSAIFIRCSKVETNSQFQNNNSTEIEIEKKDEDSENLIVDKDIKEKEIKEVPNHINNKNSTDKEIDTVIKFVDLDIKPVKETIPFIDIPTDDYNNILIENNEKTATETDKKEVKSNKTIENGENREINKQEEWTNLIKDVNNLNKNAEIYVSDNYIYYGYEKDVPAIELNYKNKIWELYLHCTLNEEHSTKQETKEIIKMNNRVLKYISKLISSDSDSLYNVIYNDYEIEDMIPTNRYEDFNSFEIKAEINMGYVLYKIKNK